MPSRLGGMTPPDPSVCVLRPALPLPEPTPTPPGPLGLISYPLTRCLQWLDHFLQPRPGRIPLIFQVRGPVFPDKPVPLGEEPPVCPRGAQSVTAAAFPAALEDLCRTLPDASS